MKTRIPLTVAEALVVAVVLMRNTRPTLFVAVAESPALDYEAVEDLEWLAFKLLDLATKDEALIDARDTLISTLPRHKAASA